MKFTTSEVISQLEISDDSFDSDLGLNDSDYILSDVGDLSEEDSDDGDVISNEIVGKIESTDNDTNVNKVVDQSAVHNFVNTWVTSKCILYKQANKNKNINHIQYRKELISQLVVEQQASQLLRRRGCLSSLDTEERLDKCQHFIAKFSGKKSKDCAVCSDRKKTG